VRRRAPDGTLTTIGPAVRALATLPDGTLVEAVAETTRSQPWIYRFGPGPLHVMMLRPSDLLAFDVWNGCDVLGTDTFSTQAIDVAPDGGLLIAGGAAIQYVPSPGATAPAAAITAAKLTRDGRVRVALRLTAPAAVRVTVWKGGRALATAESPAGGLAPRVTLAGPVKPGLHRITVQARPAGPAGPVAAAESNALLARALPVAVAQSLAERQALVLAAYEDVQVDVQPCRRLGGRRVDCPGLVGKDCAGVLSMTWERDGHLTWTIYGARRGGCRVSAGRGVPNVRRRGLHAFSSVGAWASRRSTSRGWMVS
jgi:hypothetical protein